MSTQEFDLESFRSWVGARAGGTYSDDKFERGLQAAYHDVFVRLMDNDAAEANAENGDTQ